MCVCVCVCSVFFSLRVVGGVTLPARRSSAPLDGDADDGDGRAGREGGQTRESAVELPDEEVRREGGARAAEHRRSHNEDGAVEDARADDADDAGGADDDDVVPRLAEEAEGRVVGARADDGVVDKVGECAGASGRHERQPETDDAREGAADEEADGGGAHEAHLAVEGCGDAVGAPRPGGGAEEKGCGAHEARAAAHEEERRGVQHDDDENRPDAVVDGVLNPRLKVRTIHVPSREDGPKKKTHVDQ